MKQYFVLFFICYSYLLSAQQDSALQLREVNIIDYHTKNLEQTSRIENIDTSYVSRIGSSSLAALLNTNSSVFVKDNGGGRLATLSIRGTSASENNVTWNGLALNTPTLGLSDLSLMPAFFADGITVQYGGNGSLNGDDAIGGAVNIFSMPAFNAGMHLQLMSNAGSFGDFEEGFRINYSNSNVSLKSALYHHAALNNYTIKDGSNSWKQSHAAYYQNGIQQEAVYTEGKNIFSVHFMQLDARHETPPLLSSASQLSAQVQHDNQMRIVGRWKYEDEKTGCIINAGMLNDEIHYQDALIGLDDFSKGRSYQLNAEAHYKTIHHTFLLGAHLRYAEARVNSNTILFAQGYPEYHADSKQGIYINYQLHFNAVSAQFSVRYDPSISDSIPLVPSAGIALTLSPLFNIKVNAAGIYRNPTLNDLYWTPGGNKNLLPEKGNQGDVFFNFNQKSNRLSSEMSAGIYYLDVHDYIQWLPGPDNIYRPVNEDRIISRGTELSLQEGLILSGVNMKLNAGLQYIRSTRITAGDDFSLTGSASENQLIYIPRLQWRAGYRIAYHKTTLQLSTGYVGHRYTTEDNAYWLKPYSASVISLTQQLNIRNFQLYISGTVSNPENENYEVIAQHPVAGTAYRLSLLFQL
jgi:vitamin B12 transporter